MKSHIFQSQFFAVTLAGFVENLRSAGVEVTTTEEFVEYCSGPYLTEVRTAPEHSFNAKCGRMISILRDDHGLQYAGSKRFMDYEGNRTQTAIWAISPI